MRVGKWASGRKLITATQVGSKLDPRLDPSLSQVQLQVPSVTSPNTQWLSLSLKVVKAVAELNLSVHLPISNRPS